MVNLMDHKVRFITRGKLISDEEVRGVLKGLKYFGQEYNLNADLVRTRFLDYRGLSHHINFAIRNNLE